MLWVCMWVRVETRSPALGGASKGVSSHVETCGNMWKLAFGGVWLTKYFVDSQDQTQWRGIMRNGAGFASIRPLFICHPVAHRPVTALAFFPHSQQRRVTGIDEVDDAHVGLGGVLAV
jgi:hypothetical protein